LTLAAVSALQAWAGGRVTISLDGQWEITDSKAADAIPTQFGHTTPVPGLAHSSIPAFPDVDEFDSRQVIQNRIKQHKLPETAMVTTAGVSRQDRNWFWYRRAFQAQAKRAVAILRINKAQFGAAVWLNGRKIGEHLPCFTAAEFNVTDAIRWNGANDLIIRIGAHPGVLPEMVSGGTDFEKNRWTPGIYDSVSVRFSDNPSITGVQVAPKLSDSSIVVQTVVRNYGSSTITAAVRYQVHGWKSAGVVAVSQSRAITLKPGEEQTITEKIRIPNTKLWTPEDPNLYVVETSTGGDSASTRFGMREFRFDTATKRAYLNGHVYFMRGSNVTLHRFFEDPKSGTLPWNEAWVRKLLIEIPKQMHWNSFRFCIGPAPDKWFEIADEAGLLIQNEYFVWTGRNWHGAENQKHFDVPELITEYSEWMRDNWNHPSVAIWDANNETWDPIFGEKIIPAVRGLDLSNRPWENSYNPPAGPDDPVEDHPYEFQQMSTGKADFSMTTFERAGGKVPGAPTGHARILNEYGWLWINRDGSPTVLTKNLYPKLLGPSTTAEQRIELNAYLLGGITEYWRAYREYAGVLHFVYLMSSDPGGYTADHFRDVEKLELHPAFRDYMSNAFAPLGVYLSFWQPKLDAGSSQSLQVMLVNDTERQAAGTLTIVLEDEKGAALVRKTSRFSVAALGQQTCYIDIDVPQANGKCVLKAIAEPEDLTFGGPTISRRKVTIEVKH